MISNLIGLALALNAVCAAPQFVTFKDGNFHVGFGGYTASAGLGGLLTGNAAHGGLHASAGTPTGQNAAAGLDGILNGFAGGRAYAGAQASDQIGASALIGGSTAGNAGVAGAEAHHAGISKSVVKTVSHEVPVVQVPVDVVETETAVQKVKPPKKYDSTNVLTVEKSVVVPAVTKTKTITKTVTSSAVDQPIEPVSVVATPVVFVPAHRIKSHRHHLRKHLRLHPQTVIEKRKEIVKTVQRDVSKVPVFVEPAVVETQAAGTATGAVGSTVAVHKNVQLGPGFLDQWFNIPIGILSTIRDNLHPVGGVSVKKEVSIAAAANAEASA